MRTYIVDRLRMTELLITALVLYALALVITNPQIQVAFYKCGNATLGAFGGYWIDRLAFPFGRIHQNTDATIKNGRELRRAIIIGATVLGVTLGL